MVVKQRQTDNVEMPVVREEETVLGYKGPTPQVLVTKAGRLETPSSTRYLVVSARSSCRYSGFYGISHVGSRLVGQISRRERLFNCGGQKQRRGVVP